MEQFRSERFEAMSEEELTRQFIHLWLMRVDRWVMTGDEEKSLPIDEEGSHEG